MKVKTIQSKWIDSNGHRMDCNPYMSGSIESKVKLESMDCKLDKLQDVTEGGISGIYHAGREGRTWVKSKEYGVPFLGSTDILKSDLSNLPFISKRQISKTPAFIIRKGWTLITRSGSIGRMSYARSDMDGMACSEHVMRVVPDSDKIKSGYLFAFLSSSFGVPLVVSGTYGSIIQSIEPSHVQNLPIPRIGEQLENKCHQLIEDAADLRALASVKLNEVAKQFDSILQNLDIDLQSPRISSVSSKNIQARFDAQYHDVLVQNIKEKIRTAGYTSLGKWCSKIFLPGIFKRIHIDNLDYGSYYYTGASLFWLEPKPKGILSRQTSKFDEVYLEKGMILVQAFGQDGGLTGRSVWVGDHLDKQTTTHMLVRLQSDNLKKDAFLFGFLQSEMAYKQIACLTYGGSIPHFDEAGISTVLMPLFDEDTFNQIAEDVLWAVDARDRALENEKLARQLVEESIEAAEPKN